MTDSFPVTVQTAVNVSKYIIACTLSSAFEGGSNYWYVIDKDKSQAPSEVDYEGIGFGNALFFHVHWPLSKGGSLYIEDKEDGEEYHGVLNLESIEKGLKVMAEKYPRHFGDMVAEEGDAETGDVFLQCCLFGELVFG